MLDDMKFMEKTEMEMWKGLVSAEPVSIRTAYCNAKYIGGKPVIICTNSESLMLHLFTHEYFKNDCVFYEVEDTLIPDTVAK